MERRLITALVAAVFLSGCMTPPVSHYDQGIAKLEAGDLEAAYRFLESPTRGREQEVERIMKSNPALVSAGLRTFSIDALASSISRYGRSQSLDIEMRRLKSFELYANAEQAGIAARNLELAFKGHIQDGANTDWAGHELHFIGIIIDVQTINESTSGTKAGAYIGGAYGQAAYLDSTRDYKAASQVSAGIAGAVVGSLFDKAGETKFRTTYYIKTASGDVKQFEAIMLSAVRLPVGACAEVKGSSIALVNSNTCRTISTTSPATRQTESAESELLELRQLYEKNLIDRSIYLDRQREILRK